METFNLTVYYDGRFGYDNGTLKYIGGQRTVIEDVDMDCWSIFEAYAEVGQFGYTKKKISASWYKDPNSEWLENDLKLFEEDRDAIEMCKIAEKKGHVELYVVHKGEQGQNVKRDNAKKVNEGDKLNPEEQVKSNSDDDSNDENFIPSDGEVDSADDVMFTDSEEEYNDESGFDEVRGGTDGDRVDKRKGVVGGDFSDEEGFNSDKVDVDYEVGGGSEKEDSEDDDNNEASRYLIHKDDTAYWLSRAFKKKVKGNPKVKIKDLVNKAQRKWNLTVITSMVARSRQAALDEIQETYRKQYKRIADYCSELIRANPGSSVTLKQLQEEIFWTTLEAADVKVCKSYTLEGIGERDVNHQTDQCGESRKKSIVTILEDIRVYLMSRWAVNRERIKKFNGTVLPRIRMKLERRGRSAGEWRPYWSAAQTYKVVNGLNKFAINLSAHECSCRKWQLSGIPCTHTISCINFKGLDIDAFVDDCYKKPAYVKCYDSTQQPRQAAIKRTKGGRKPSSSRPITSSKASSQPAMQSASEGRRRFTRSKASSQPQLATTSSKPNSTHFKSKPTSPSTKPNTPPAGTLHLRPKRKLIRITT
ncbi:hypothetical protein Ahy_A10g050009 [Arachis hypogaea]|uniref:SWIM-type domain-containing protein n=1 Tax=Arachis hypogaea TaxID=3818 RepID=A0A445B8D4_ARAHY|nr:hypothetical protein Ahy_A10g050009 [Arachis hypogaea]